VTNEKTAFREFLISYNAESLRKVQKAGAILNEEALPLTAGTKASGRSRSLKKN